MTAKIERTTIRQSPPVRNLPADSLTWLCERCIIKKENRLKLNKLIPSVSIDTSEDGLIYLKQAKPDSFNPLF